MTRSSRDTIADKNRLIARIQNFNVVMSRSCNNCFHSKKRCIVFSDFFRRCSECVRLSRTCSFVTFDLDWNKLIDAIDRIEREETNARVKVFEMFTRLNRLEKQKKLFRSKVEKFLQFDVQIGEKLKAQEQKKEKKRHKIINDQRLLNLKTQNLFDFFFDLSAFQLEFLNQFSVDETVESLLSSFSNVS